MKVQHIANFEQRMQSYRRELRVFWIETLTMFVVCSVAFLVILYGMTELIGLPLGINLLPLSAAMGVVSMIPRLLIWKPVRPVSKDIQNDQMLRRTFGLDDTVEK